MSDNSIKNKETLSDVIETAFDAMKKNIHTSMVCIVESFDGETTTLSAKPTIRRVFKDPVTKEVTEFDLPLLINLPVVISGGGGFSATFPISKGDECLVVFSERSIDDWFDSGEVKTQRQVRFHALSDGIAIVGLRSSKRFLENYNNDEFQIRSDDGETSISITKDDKIKLKGQVEIEGSLKTTGDVETIGDVSTTGNIESTGTVKNNNINIGSTHIHPQAPDSDGDTQQPTGAPTP